jgi:hypothetical protein
MADIRSTDAHDHEEIAVGHLIEQYKGETTFEGLVEAPAGQTQAIEDALWQCVEELGADDAVGDQLDGLGDIVGQERLGWDDDTYRVFLKARLAINRSSGTAEELIRIFNVLEPDATVVITEYFPAGMTVRLDDAAVEYGEEYAGILQDAKASAIDAALEWTETTEALTFCMDGGAGLGFGDATDPATGGKFSGAM